jgi:hypothetical protein
MEQAAASKRQIFTTAEGFKMLSKELTGIIRRQDATLFADSVGDDVWVSAAGWAVWHRFRGFGAVSKALAAWRLVCPVALTNVGTCRTAPALAAC